MSTTPPEHANEPINESPGLSEGLLDLLLQHLPCAVFVKDREGVYRQANQRWAELLGRQDPETIKGHTDTEFFAAERAHAHRFDEERIILSGETLPERIEWIDQTGGGNWCSINRIPLRDARGAVTGVVGIVRDVTDQMVNEKRERTTTQDLKAVVEIADRLIASPDLDTLLRKAVELARMLLRIERCSILLNRDDHLVGTYGTDLKGRTTDERDKIIPMDAAWDNRFRTWNRKSSQWIVERDIQRSSPDARAATVRDFWVATTPIKGSHNRMIGVFCNDAVISGHPPDEHLQDVIAVFCSLLGNIIERQRSMDELRKRDQVLDGVARSSSQLLTGDDLDPSIRESLRVLGESMQVDRVSLFACLQDPLTGEWNMSQRYEWVQHPALPTLGDERWQELPFLPDFTDMLERLSAGAIYDGLTSRLPPGPRRLMESLQVVSFLRVPIHLDNRLWGFIGFDEARAAREWSGNEKAILLAMAGNLGGAISRDATGRQLKARDRILSAVARANHELLTNPDVLLAIGQTLRIMAPAVPATRIFLCENQDGAGREQPMMVPRFLYDKVSTQHRSFAPSEISLPYDTFFPRWYAVMAAGRIVSGRVLEFLTEDANRVNSVLMAPLIVEKKFWGILGFDTADAGYDWTESDTSALSTIAGSISAAIARHRAEISLRQSEEHFRSLIENASDLIIMVDNRGDVLYASPSVNRELGINPATPGNLNFFTLIHSEDWNELRGMFDPIRTAPDHRLHLFRIRHPAGEWRNLECAFQRIRDEHGNTRFIINARDITERQRTEDALRRSEDLLRHSQKMEAVGRLAGGVAHDFNNLLTAILGYSDMLTAQIPEGHEWRKEITEIARAAERAHSLTRQLLAFSRRQVLEPKSIDLNQIVADLERMLKRLINEDVSLTTELDPAACPVKVDRGQIEQVVINLCLNARDAMPGGGQLRIATANRLITEPITQGLITVKPGRYILLKVADTGHGIRDEVKPHVFEPFFTTKEVGKGTGLGLSMVYGIIEQSSGYILFDSAVGVGTEFTIYLPMADEPAGAGASDRPPPSTAGGAERILLIEDDKIVRELSTRILRDKGYQVTTRENGAEALAYFKENAGAIDLVLTDIIMPQMSGLTFARAARAIRPDLRILFISGYAEDHQPDAHETSNGRNYIQKPFTVSSLCGKVREILDSPV